VITLGELYFGAHGSRHTSENLRQVADFALATPILGCDQTTAEEYAIIRNHLRTIGHMIPDNDIWIAATARQHGLTLVTRDAHFQHIPNLPVESW
jgi:tRNA(fMet)-specific endonuclease VapC